jgi:hypothetical protein
MVKAHLGYERGFSARAFCQTEFAFRERAEPIIAHANIASNPEERHVARDSFFSIRRRPRQN